MVRTKLPVIITSVVGFLMIAEYFLKIPALNTASSALQSWGSIVAAFATFMGVLNVVIINVRQVRRSKGKDSFLNVVLLVSLAVMGLTCTFMGTNSPAAVFMYDGIIVAVESSVFSLLAFFVTSAAYRAFRVRNAESTVLLITAILVLLGQTPAAQAIFPWMTVPAKWIGNYVNVAAQRGIIITTGAAFIGLSLRVLLGISRGMIGETE